MAQNLRGYFLCCKADDEGMLSHAEEDNAAARKIDRKGGTVLKLVDYIGYAGHQREDYSAGKYS